MRPEPSPPVLDLPPIVLILEGNAEMRELYETALKMSGIWTASVADPDEAFTFAEDIRPDAILADIETAGAGRGVALAERLRSDARTVGIPILGIRNGGVPGEGLGLFDAVLQKPIDLPALAGRIRDAIARGAALRAQGNRARARIPELLKRSERLLERSQSAADAAPALALPDVPRTCPRCAAALHWVERRQISRVVFDYYRPCDSGCGLFCYDHARRTFVTLIG